MYHTPYTYISNTSLLVVAATKGNICRPCQTLHSFTVAVKSRFLISPSFLYMFHTLLNLFSFWKCMTYRWLLSIQQSILYWNSTHRYLWTIRLSPLKQIHECCLISRDHNCCHIHDKNNHVNIKIVLGWACWQMLILWPEKKRYYGNEKLCITMDHLRSLIINCCSF